jgi:hypothetical protein
MDANSIDRFGPSDHAEARGDAALQQVRAQFDPISPRRLRGANASYGIDAYLVDHGCLLTKAATFDSTKRARSPSANAREACDNLLKARFHAGSSRTPTEDYVVKTEPLTPRAPRLFFLTP